jgi:PAS domain S-box-containing protein
VIFNERWAEIVGYKLEELYPISTNTWRKLCHPEDLDFSNKELEKHFKGEIDFYDIEARMRHKNGHWVWVHDRGKLVTRDANGKPEWLFGTHTDITVRKRMEEELKRSSFKYKTVADWTYAWEYWLSPENEIIYISPSAERITGYKVEEFTANPKLLEEIVLDEDREIVKKHICEKLKEKNGGLYNDYEYRLLTKNGDIRSIHHICRKIYDEDGKYLGIRASNRDITENKKAIETISKLSTVIEQIPIAIVIADKNGIIEYANKMTKEVTGYDVEKLIGKKTSVFKSVKTAKKKYEKLWDTILSGRIWNGKILNKRKNGELYWEK